MKLESAAFPAVALLSAAACAFFLAMASGIALAGQQPANDSPGEPQSGGVSGASPQVPAPSTQTPQPPPSPLKRKRTNCPHSADPHRRHTGCKDEEFEWDETLSRDWTGLRTKLRTLGISPSLSYTGVLQSNVSGGPHQIWGYAGQLVAGLNVDLEKLLKVRGMSVYVGGSWGTGDNISGTLQTVFPVNSIYAPTYYLGEMYLQQTLLDNRLTLLGGRVAAANTFATLPVLANYVNYGLNPNPYPLGDNDITFFGPPTGTEWGAQATYDVTPLVQISAGLFNTNLNSATGTTTEPTGPCNRETRAHWSLRSLATSRMES